MDLSTTYLGMRLPHPLVVGAGPLGDQLDVARALEDAGASLLMLRSLCEEITGEQMDEFLHVESFNDSMAGRPASRRTVAGARAGRVSRASAADQGSRTYR